MELNTILAIDTGTLETGYCLIDAKTYKPLDFGKIKNEEVIEKIASYSFEILAYEQFQNFGMPVGASTIKSIEWNGRMIQKAFDRGITVYPIYRIQEKSNICKNPRAKDVNIRAALIDRFGEVGTKNNQGWFYGFKKDIWSAYAVGITFLDYLKEGKINVD